MKQAMSATYQTMLLKVNSDVQYTIQSSRFPTHIVRAQQRAMLSELSKKITADLTSKISASPLEERSCDEANLDVSFVPHLNVAIGQSERHAPFELGETALAWIANSLQ